MGREIKVGPNAHTIEVLEKEFQKLEDDGWTVLTALPMQHVIKSKIVGQPQGVVQVYVPVYCRDKKNA